MQLFIYQLKQAFLSLKQTPLFVFGVVSTMAIALGTLLCVMTLAYIMLIKPLPYPDQQQLFTVKHQLINNNHQVDGDAFTYPNLMYLHDNQELFTDSALLYIDADVITSLSSKPMMEIKYVTPQWFSMLGIEMAIGRAFEQSEAINSYHPVAILSYQTWQDEFNGDENILDQHISFGGKSYQVIGVITKEYQELAIAGAGFNTQLYIPWDYNSVNERDRKAWGNDDGGLMFIGKTASNSGAALSTSQRNQQLTNLVNNNWLQQVKDSEFFNDWSIKIEATPLQDHIINNSKNSVYLLIIGALGLTLIATANIANLFISRTAERQHQLAICAALGANQKQLFFTLFTEISLVTLTSVLIAQLIATFGFQALHYYLADHLPRINELGLNGFSLAFSLVLFLIFTLTFSLISLKMINYRRLNLSLQSSGKGNAVQVSKLTRTLLITSQITIASTLIFINILLYQNAKTLINQPLGYHPENVHALVLSLGDFDKEQRIEKLTQLKTSLESHPKITAVSQSMRPSLFGIYALTTEQDNQRFSTAGKDVDEHYFDIIGQSIIAGDNFTSQQANDREPVLIVNDIFAKQLSPDGNVIGKRFTNGARIVGVVKSINIAGRKAPAARFYYLASRARNMLLIKLVDGQTLTRDEVIKQLTAVDERINLFSYASLTEYKNRRLFSATTTVTMTMAISLITILLSGIGLYGVLKYSSQMRRFEIGTRMAIGAKRYDIITMIFKEHLIGIAIGSASSIVLLLIIYLSVETNNVSLNYLNITITYLATTTVISLMTLLACYIPLRQYISQPVIHCLRNSE